MPPIGASAAPAARDRLHLSREDWRGRWLSAAAGGLDRHRERARRIRVERHNGQHVAIGASLHQPDALRRALVVDGPELVRVRGGIERAQAVADDERFLLVLIE